MTLESLIARGEELHQALGRESYLTGAGLKDTPEFQRIFDKYADLGSDEAMAEVQASGSTQLLEWIVDLRVGRRTATLKEDQLLWEQRAVLKVDGVEVPYLRAPIDLANASDRSYRVALEDARVAAGAAGLNGIRRDRFALEREEVLAAGLGDYVTARAAFSGIDLEALGRSAEGFLSSTDDLYRDVLKQIVKRRLGLDLDELVRADTRWAFRVERFDGVFTPDRLVPTATRQARDMGLDPLQDGRITLDAGERPGKQPRAFCAAVRIPDEVYLVLRPRGGHADYQTFWHEYGHALHFASADPGLPFAARWLGDNSVTEGFAMLFDHMTLNRGWLARYAGLAARDAADLVFELGVNDLFMVRRYAAKLAYELVLHRRNLDRMGPEYAERLSRATLFRYPEGEYLLDVDPGFYAARYLRAWQLQALLAETLTERFDDDWYRNPRTGEYVQHLMRRGQADNGDQVAQGAAGATLSFDPLRRSLENMLEG